MRSRSKILICCLVLLTGVWVGCSEDEGNCGNEADAKALTFTFRPPVSTSDRAALRDDQLRRVRIVVLSKSNQTAIDSFDLRDDFLTGQLRVIKLDDLLIKGSPYPLSDYAYRIETDFTNKRLRVNPDPDTTTRIELAGGVPQRRFRIDDIRVATAIDAARDAACTVNTVRQFRVDGVRYDWSSQVEPFALPPRL